MPKLNRTGNIQQIIFHQHQICRFNGYIRTGANGNAHIGTCQCRCVVNAVANHGNFFALLLQTAYFRFLILRQNLRHHAVSAYLFLYGLRCARVVAGKHYYLQPHALHFFYGRAACRFYPVCQGNNAEQYAVTGKKQRCFAFGRQFFFQHFYVIIIKPGFFQHSAVAAKTALAFHYAFNAAPGLLRKACYRHKLHVFLFRIFYNRLCQRVFGIFFQ